MPKNKVSSKTLPTCHEDVIGSSFRVCLWISACFLGLSVFSRDGMGSLPAKFLLLGATLFAGFAPWAGRFQLNRRFLNFSLLILLIATLALPVTRIPGYYLQAASQSEFHLWLGLRSIAAVAGIACWFFMGRYSKFLFCLCCSSIFLACCWTLRASPQPTIDVFFFFKSATTHLLNGNNPYTQAMPNIYGSGTTLYAPELIQGDTLRFGFPYPLGSLLGPALGSPFFPDYRFGVLLAYVAAVMWLGFQGLVERKIALLALFFPRLEFVFEQGWSDAWSGALLLWTAVFSRNFAGGLFAGVWIASKQYLIPFALPWLCILRKQRITALTCIGLSGFLYLLPLIDQPKDYLWSVFGLQFIQPFRPDSLSFLFGPGYLTILAVGIWLLGLIPRIRLLAAAPRYSAYATFGFLHWTLWAFFIFNKQAFANYFFTLYLLTLWITKDFLNPKKAE
ncbi:hypothetical protein EBT23_04490 [bacterium]|nr:hypothetical protein [bacterium]